MPPLTPSSASGPSTAPPSSVGVGSSNRKVSKPPIRTTADHPSRATVRSPGGVSRISIANQKTTNLELSTEGLQPPLEKSTDSTEVPHKLLIAIPDPQEIWRDTCSNKRRIQSSNRYGLCPTANIEVRTCSIRTKFWAGKIGPNVK